MNCGELKSRLDSWLDRETGEEETRALENHVAECVSCRERVEGEKALRGFLRSQLMERAPSELVERVRGKISSPASFFRRNLISGAAALLLVGLIGMIIFSHPNPVTANTIAANAIQEHGKILGDLHDSDTHLCVSSCCTDDSHGSLKEFFRKQISFSPCTHDLTHLGYQNRHGSIWQIRTGKFVSWSSHEHPESGSIISHASMAGMEVSHGGGKPVAEGTGRLYKRTGSEVVVMFPNEKGVTCLFVFDNAEEAARFLSSR